MVTAALNPPRFSWIRTMRPIICRMGAAKLLVGHQCSSSIQGRLPWIKMFQTVSSHKLDGDCLHTISARQSLPIKGMTANIQRHPTFLLTKSSLRHFTFLLTTTPRFNPYKCSRSRHKNNRQEPLLQCWLHHFYNQLSLPYDFQDKKSFNTYEFKLLIPYFFSSNKFLKNKNRQISTFIRLKVCYLQHIQYVQFFRTKKSIGNINNSSSSQIVIYRGICKSCCILTLKIQRSGCGVPLLQAGSKDGSGVCKPHFIAIPRLDIDPDWQC